MEKVFKKESFSAEDTFAIGKELAAQAKPGEVYCLYGDLGCGKTVFSQGFGAGGDWVSPSGSRAFLRYACAIRCGYGNRDHSTNRRARYRQHI